MDKNYLIQLTQNLYRLTLLFPKKEPLRYKMREIADEILANWLRNTNTYEYTKKKNETKQDFVSLLEVVDGFFEVAKAQNWVAVVDILRIQEEYNRIKAEIKKIPKRPLAEGHLIENDGVEPRLNERQEKILEILKENGRVQVWQLKQVLPEVTKRTLRRDFENLLKQGKIERIGERNDTFYQLPTNYE